MKILAAFLLCVCVLPSSAGAELVIDWRRYEGGRYEIDVINKGREEIKLLRAVVNDRVDDPRCSLVPVRDEFGWGLIRSDLDLAAEGWGRSYENLIALGYGEFVTAGVSMYCGKLLEFRVILEDDEAIFTVE